MRLQLAFYSESLTYIKKIPLDFFKKRQRLDTTCGIKPTANTKQYKYINDMEDELNPLEIFKQKQANIDADKAAAISFLENRIAGWKAKMEADDIEYIALTGQSLIGGKAENVESSVKEKGTRTRATVDELNAIKDKIVELASKEGGVVKSEIVAAFPAINYNTKLMPIIKKLKADGKLKQEGDRATAVYKVA